MLTDKQDYDEIYEKYKNLVMKAAYKYSGNYDIAEDITQSTFLQLYMYIDELKDINIKAWMYTTAKHMALNYNKKAEREVLSETGDDPVILDLEDSAEDTYMERMKDDEQTSLHEEIFAALYKHNPRWYDAIRYSILLGDSAVCCCRKNGDKHRSAAQFTLQSKKMDQKKVWCRV